MPNVSKPSGEKATGLLSGRFHQGRLQLTLVYIAILTVILLLSSASSYSLFSSRLEFRFARFHLRPPQTIIVPNLSPSPADVQDDLIHSLLVVNGALLLAASLASYWLAGITLQPIQAAYNRQRRFLGDASHELRTPLAILQTDLENERTDIYADEGARRRIASHLEEVGRMSRIVNDLLVLSRLDEKDETFSEGKPINLSGVVQQTTHRLQGIAQRQGITLTCVDEDGAYQAMADQNLFSQALSNVIKNAIAYNTEHGRVMIEIQREGTQIVVRVTDTGIGIAKKDLEKIFDRFYRTDQSRSRQTGGSGLGLAIVQSIMKQLRGSVHIESVLGQGTVVTLRLPKAPSSFLHEGSAMV